MYREVMYTIRKKILLFSFLTNHSLKNINDKISSSSSSSSSSSGDGGGSSSSSSSNKIWAKLKLELVHICMKTRKLSPMQKKYCFWITDYVTLSLFLKKKKRKKKGKEL